MPEQDHCPACAWSPPLPSIFPPVLPGASHHLPPGCSVLATVAAHHTIPIRAHHAITLSPGHAHHVHCAVPMASPSCCPSTPHVVSPPHANGYKEHLIILVNCLCLPLLPPGDFLTNGV